MSWMAKFPPLLRTTDWHMNNTVWLLNWSFRDSGVLHPPSPEPPDATAHAITLHQPNQPYMLSDAGQSQTSFQDDPYQALHMRKGRRMDELERGVLAARMIHTQDNLLAKHLRKR